jgi:hypothetical protein
MNTFKIVGSHNVVGHEPGSIITSDDLTGVDIQHLIDAGHIEPTSKGRKAEPNNNQED